MALTGRISSPLQKPLKISEVTDYRFCSLGRFVPRFRPTADDRENPKPMASPQFSRRQVSRLLVAATTCVIRGHQLCTISVIRGSSLTETFVSIADSLRWEIPSRRLGIEILTPISHAAGCCRIMGSVATIGEAAGRIGTLRFEGSLRAACRSEPD